MRASARALSSFKITIGGGSTTLAGFQTIGIHRQTHGATRFTPFKPRIFENHVQTFGFGLLFHQTRAGNHKRQFHIARHLFAQAFDHPRGGTHIFNTAVGTRADKHFVHLDRIDRRARSQSHILQSTLHRIALDRIFFQLRIRYRLINRHHHLR